MNKTVIIIIIVLIVIFLMWRGCYFSIDEETAKRTKTVEQNSMTMKEEINFTVYINDEDELYHYKDCPKLGPKFKPASLLDAKKKFSACTECKPPK